MKPVDKDVETNNLNVNKVVDVEYDDTAFTQFDQPKTREILMNMQSMEHPSVNLSRNPMIHQNKYYTDAKVPMRRY